MIPLRWLAIGLLIAAARTGTAEASLQTYEYAVKDGTFGRIGTFQETVDRNNGETRLLSELHIAFSIGGIVVHRESAYTNALVEGQWLRSLHAATIVNGVREEVSGEDRQGSFVVSSKSGTATISGGVAPSDPWVLRALSHGAVVSTRTGAVYEATASGGEQTQLVILGASIPARHFRVDTPIEPDRFDVWLNEDGVPLKFCTHERSRLITFELVSPSLREQPPSR